VNGFEAGTVCQSGLAGKAEWVDHDNHNYNSKNLLAVISSCGLHLSKVHSRCNTDDRQRLKRVRRRLTMVDITPSPTR